MSVRIVADSSCDLITLATIDFVSVPLGIRTEHAEYVDDAALDVADMVEALSSYQGRSYTACPGISQWEAAFDGADQICIFTVTQALSGSYNAARAAMQMHLQQYPHKQMHLVDTRSAGPEIALAIEKYQQLLHDGVPFTQACSQIDRYVRTTGLLFTLKSLHNFAQNGRVSKLAAAACGVLGIQIIGYASEEGTLALLTKLRGFAKVCVELVSKLIQMGYEGGQVFIGHVQNEQGVQLLIQKIHEVFPQAPIKAYAMRGLCSYYGQKGGILIGFERCGAIET